MKRRDFLTTVAAGMAAVPMIGAQAPAPQAGAQARGGRAGGRGGTPYTPSNGPKIARKGRIRQGAFLTTFGDLQMTLDDQCKEAVRIGLAGFELAGANTWPTLKKYGLTCTCAGSPQGMTFDDGIIHPEGWDRAEQGTKATIDACAANGIERFIAVGGKRRRTPAETAMGYEEAADNAVKFLNRIKSYAEDKNVIFALEIMNTRYPDDRLGRPEQVFDHLDWGVNVMKRVNSPMMKVLFDIYHVQIADGNVVALLKEAYPFISHFHTAGVPGRNEIDETQELNYGFIAQTLVDLGFKGPVSHEYRPGPGKDPIKSLEKCVGIIDV